MTDAWFPRALDSSHSWRAISAALHLALFASLAACGDDEDKLNKLSPLAVAEQRQRECVSTPLFACSDSALWSSRETEFFGQENYPIDRDGCMRITCREDSDCTGGQKCHHPNCYPRNVDCSDQKGEDGEVTCVCSGDPACGGGYCVAR